MRATSGSWRCSLCPPEAISSPLYSRSKDSEYSGSSAFVMTKADEPEYSESFDLEYKGDEMASGGQREHRHDPLVARMKEKGLNPESFEFYLKAFRYGMPPHGGWGFGLDRFVQKLLDLPNRFKRGPL